MKAIKKKKKAQESKTNRKQKRRWSKWIQTKDYFLFENANGTDTIY